jgi:amino acid permease
MGGAVGVGLGVGLLEGLAVALVDAGPVAVPVARGCAADDVQALSTSATRMAVTTPQVIISRVRLAADTDAS